MIRNLLVLALLLMPVADAAAQETSGKARLTQSIKRELADWPLKALNGATSGRQHDRYLNCFAEAVVADMPDQKALLLAQMFDHEIPMDRAFAESWFPVGKGEDNPRHREINMRMREICPDLMSAP